MHQGVDVVSSTERAGRTSTMLGETTAEVVGDPHIEGARTIGQDVDEVLMGPHPRTVGPTTPSDTIVRTPSGAFERVTGLRVRTLYRQGRTVRRMGIPRGLAA